MKMIPRALELNFKAVGGAISKAVESDAMMDFMDDHWADEIQAYKEGKLTEEEIRSCAEH